MSKGWVYVISNKSMPGLVKVGFSTKDPEDRAKELHHTGSPHPYVVEYEMLIEEAYRIEQQTHRYLSSKHEDKEWFRCSAEEAVAAIKQVAGQRASSETYKRVKRAKAEALYQQELDRRKREKTEKEVEDWLRNEEVTIREKFERQIAASFHPHPFWPYWLGSGILVAIALGIFEAKISVGGGFMLSVIGGSIAAFFLQDYFEKKFEEKHKRSIVYISLERQRDEELAAVRAKAKLKKFMGDEVEIARCTQKVEKVIGGILTAADCRKCAIGTKVKIIVNAPKQNVINMITNSYPGIITDNVATNIYIALTES